MREGKGNSSELQGIAYRGSLIEKSVAFRIKVSVFFNLALNF
jgi:hypothetical protein